MAIIIPLFLFIALEPAERVVSAENQIPTEAPVGERPYEMIWAGRVEERLPLVDFEELSGWKVALYNGAEATFSRSREQQMWGQYVGKLNYRGASKESRLIVQPPSPITVPNEFDCINLWCYGNNWAWAPDPATPQVNLALLLEDAKAQSYRIPLTHIRWKEWWLIHKRIDSETLSRLQFPCRLVGLEVSGASNSEDRTLYFDSLSFYKEEGQGDIVPLRFEPRPARNIKPFPGQRHGLNGTGEGTLPFPTREETILPENRETQFENKVLQNDDGDFELRYLGKDADIRYLYQPRKGELGEVITVVNGKKVARPLSGGGVRFEDNATLGQLESATIEENRISATFLYCHGERAHRVQYNLQIKQRSLILDVFCLGGDAAELSVGQMEEVENPQLIQIPYLTYGRSNPRVLMMGTAKSPLFASVWVDWYRSNSSELYSEEKVEGNSAKINGGVRYHPKTDGKRNDLFERLFLTFSPTFEETLPTIANPPSPWGEEAGNYLWQESWGPENYEKEHQRSKMLRSYGIERLIQCNHEITWRDDGESFTLRTKAAPKRGGDEALKNYVAAQKSLGWCSGLYTNYCDYGPVNENWDEDQVQRTPQNEWRSAWARCYALKPSRAVEWDAKLAPIIKQKFDPNSAYTDVHTAVAPWAYCDYDARVPGAGTFAATFYAYGEILLNDQKVYGGPIFSEGTYQWLYAGLASGNYALAYTDMNFCDQPLQVAFDLLKIHPLECDIGMPWTAQFFGKQKGWNQPDKIEASIDRFIAATLAYGHIGWLVEEGYGIRRACRSYYLIQQTAKRYAMRRPVKIEYADEKGNWLSVSQALATGAIKDSRLHVVYENGLELFVNWQQDRDWKVMSQGLPWPEVILPPNGFIAFDKNGFLAASALINGHRVDQVISDEYVYLDGRGSEASNDWLAASGAVAMKFINVGAYGHRPKDVGAPLAAPMNRIQLTDIEGNERIGFRCDLVRPICIAYDADGHEIGNVVLEQRDEKFWFNCVKGARWYEVR